MTRRSASRGILYSAPPGPLGQGMATDETDEGTEPRADVDAEESDAAAAEDADLSPGDSAEASATDPSPADD